MTIKLLSTLLMLVSLTGLAQDTYDRNESVDIQHYTFNLLLNDENNKIVGETIVTIALKEEVDNFSLDLIERNGEFGMDVMSIESTDSLEGTFTEIGFTYRNNKINISPNREGKKVRKYRIRYEGVAEKGLVIDTTKFGQRSFFGDNWPTLARHWLPCIDHPYDKASVEFAITAPAHYDVVATGKKVEESSLEDGLKLTRYYEPAPVAMKVVTIGVTRFASKVLKEVQGIPVSAWVYPENRLEGFSDYAVAVDVLEYFIDRIGPYSYAKLANMQAKTQWGGLENAGTIAYFENSVTGEKTVEGLIAHEVAHQWFGNSATENDWTHVWLSEGFATYFAILYLEEVYGEVKRKEELLVDREQVITYYKKTPAPIVDLTIKDPLKVLSANTYQKGGWALNMLRKKMGDEIFWKGIGAYYSSYQNANVLTKDFQKSMEQVSGLDLNEFFEQWLFTKGYPEIKWDWKYKKGRIIVNIDQQQSHHIYSFPLELGIKIESEMTIQTLEVNTKTSRFELEVTSKPSQIQLDPNVWLLFEDQN